MSDLLKGWRIFHGAVISSYIVNSSANHDSERSRTTQCYSPSTTQSHGHQVMLTSQTSDNSFC